jgi:hypothetical protein
MSSRYRLDIANIDLGCYRLSQQIDPHNQARLILHLDPGSPADP